MLNKIFRAGLLLMGVGLFSGCAADLTINDLTGRGLDELVFPAPAEELQILRSRYIMGAIGLYGVRSVREYSRDRKEEDAGAILTRLKTVNDKLIERRKALSGQVSLSRYHYQRYRDLVFRLLRVAVEPTKRYYRNNVMSAIASQNPIAGAKTALKGIEGIAKVGGYYKSMKKDAQKHFVEIISNKKELPQDEINSLWEKRLISNSPGAGKPKGVDFLLQREKKWYEGILSEKLLAKIRDEKLSELEDWEKDYILAAMKYGGINEKYSLYLDINGVDWDRASIWYIEACKTLVEYSEADKNLFQCK